MLRKAVVLLFLFVLIGALAAPTSNSQSESVESPESVESLESQEVYAPRSASQQQDGGFFGSVKKYIYDIFNVRY
ncbi:unnamed protein product [Bursaphelenchus xylophilus]|uniref:(pine wood nematode) hypothetical protein n=1 Tax=Bursaphelenchus xylophilus TaxID=6326 RepID=A0A1I7RXM0_BURXY|nr:unnamed protein product [Bursaphelenchus xylophilus]CAG9126571.1 unnamed protein product [Bursaphelenchus xylophilus]